MKKYFLLLCASIFTLSTANLALAEDAFPPSYKCSDRAYRVIWDFDDEDGIFGTETIQGPLASDVQEAALGSECCFTAEDDFFGESNATIGSRTGVVVDTSNGGDEGLSHGRLVSTNLAKTGENVAYQVQITFNGTEADLGLVIMEALSGAVPETPTPITGCAGSSNDPEEEPSLTTVGTADHGDGFITVAYELVTNGDDLTNCTNLHLAFEGMTNGIVIDQITIDVAYFTGETLPDGGSCFPPVLSEGEVSLSENDVLTTGAFTVVMDTSTEAQANPGSAVVTVTIDPNSGDPTTTSLTDYSLATALGVSAAGVPVTLTFDVGNWHIPQTVTVTAIDDAVLEPNIICVESFGVGFSVSLSEPNENPSLDGSVSRSSGELISILDNEAGCVIIEESSIQVNELDPNEPNSCGVISYSLSRSPATPVIVTAESEDTTITFSPSTLTFDNTDWADPQEIVVKAVPDDEFVGGEPGLTAAISSSSNGESGDLSFFNPIEGVTVTIIQDECGELPFLSKDLNEDCFVNLLDFSIFSTQWFQCTEPDSANCPN